MLIYNSAVFLVDVDKKGQFKYRRVNRAFEEITGFSNDFISGKTPIEVFGKEVGEDLWHYYKQCAEQQQKLSYEETYDFPSGRKTWLSRLTPITTDGTVSQLAGALTDITQRKENEGRKSAILEGTNAGTWEWNVQTGKTFFNERWAEIIGYTLEELEPISIDTWTAYTHPDDLKRCQDNLERHFRGGIDYYECECRMKHKDGHWVWVHDRGAVMDWTKDGEPVWMFGTHTDITKLKRTQQALEEQKNALHERNKEINCFFMMSEIVQKKEQTLAEMLQQFADIIPPAFQTPEMTCARITFKEEEYNSEDFKESPYKLSSDILFHDEKAGSLEVFLLKQPQKDNASPFLENEKVLIDSLSERIGRIAERKDSEMKLFVREREFRTLFETMAQGVVYHDSSGKITAANPAAQRILGLSLDQLQGRTSTDPRWRTIHEDGSPFPGEDHPAMVALRTGQSVFGEIIGVYHPLEEQYHWIKVNAIPQYQEGEEEPYQVYASFEDITKEIEAHLALKRSREKYFQLFENIKNGVAIYRAVDNGEDFEIVNLNKAGEKIEKISKNQVIGRRVTEAFPGIREFKLLEVFKEVWQTGEPQEHRAELYKDQRISGWRDNRVYKLPSGEIVAVYEDVTPKMRAEKELERFKTISDKALYGTCITDLNGKILYINDYLAKIHGYEPEEITGKNASLFHTGDQLQKFIKTTKPQLKSSEHFPATEIWHRHKNGKDFPMLMTGILLKNEEEEEAPYIAFSAVDITNQKELEASLTAQKEELKAFNEEIEAMNEELRESVEEAQKANKAKSEFLSTMSHELRTPLNGVIGFSEILKNTGLNHDQLEYINTVLYSANHLLEIINDILDLSMIEARKIELRPEKTDLRALIEKTLSLIRNNADHKGLKLSVDIPDNVPQIVEVDGPRLKQILLNLMSNAVKFTDEGVVKLSVNLLERQERQALLRFKVTDSGIGIKEEDQELIFEPFRQLDMSSTRQYGGTGLGVTITHDLLQKMGSTLKLESTYGEGSEFSFELVLPCGEESEKNTSDQAEPSEDHNDGSFKNKTILVAEDDPVNMKYARTALSLFSKDIQIVEAGNGEEAYRQYLKHRPDLILMDIVMPGIDGYQATGMIRQEDVHTPIIAMTAKALKTDREDCLNSGMDDYISKPVSLDRLKQMLVKYL